MRLCVTSHVLLVFGACSAAPEIAPTPILVQVLLPGADGLDESAWSPPLERHPCVTGARLGEVVVSGIWTVYYELDAEDSAWLDRLRREHGDCRVTWAGLVLNGGGKGYIMHMRGKAHAAQVLAQPPWSNARRDSER